MLLAISVPAAGRASLSILAVLPALLVSFVVAQYPLPAWPLAAALIIYAAALWRWPALFLLILPIAVPALDLGLWTGWMMVGESDLIILTTLAVLLIRAPPRADDLRMPAAILAITVSWAIATIIGLFSPLGAAYSDNPFLHPDNALRLAKPLAEALALLPFIHHRHRHHGDAVTLLGWGFAAGLVAVTLIVVAERLLFASFLDFSTEYRVAGPFSSMRVGGGHIGAYAALALPFSLTLLTAQPRWLGTILALLACLCGGYTIAVTFARAAYAATLLGLLVTGLGWLVLKTRGRTRSAAAGILPITLVAAALAIAAGFTGMQTRFAASALDYLTRQDNWRAGLAVRDRDIPTTLFGMGLGTYQRAMLVRSPVNRPTDLVLRRDDAGSYVSMRIESPFFLGQKITLPETGPLHLTLRARSPERAMQVGVLVCDKVLLYSDNCRGPDLRLAGPNVWTALSATIPTAELGGRPLLGLLRRPVELSLFGSLGHTLELRDITLVDDSGRPLLVNGDFAHALNRWIFTDDSHVSWRMLNQYLMLFFETGILGLTAFCTLAAFAISGGLQASRRGSVTGAAVMGAIAAFMISSLFDNVLEAPRLALLFFLVCLCGLIMRQKDPDTAG